MFKNKDEIERLVEIFKKRNVFLYHACQLKDFDTYLKLGGIPSREKMEKSYFSFTGFTSDQTDKNKGNWNKIFGNLSDIGEAFFMGRNATPNVYGPILIKVDPSSFIECEDISICLRSASAFDFNRENESLNIDNIERIFMANNGNQIRWTSELRSLFPDKKSLGYPEIGFNKNDQIIKIKYFTEILLDPLELVGNNLKFYVRNILKENNIIRERVITERYKELIDFIVKNKNNLTEYTQDFQYWYSNIIADSNKRRIFENFKNYLTQGTIAEIYNQINSKDIA